MSEPLLYCLKKYGLIATLRTRLRGAVIKARWLYLTKIWGMDIHPVNLISLKANLDRTYPKGIHIGEGTCIANAVIVMTHDHSRYLHTDTYIGKFCHVGMAAIILPGVKIGDHSIVGAGSVVTKDVPPNSIAVGNPARVIREGIMTTQWGRIIDAEKSAI